MRVDVTFDGLFSSVLDSHECRAESYLDLNDPGVLELLSSPHPHLTGAWHRYAEGRVGELVQATGDQ
jgi:hypothetical protein